VTWHYQLLTTETIRGLRARGKTIYSWTVDSEIQMRRLIDERVDAIITNRPDLLNQVLAGH
jgi:glycerophosphoryl diester phosphodiesterase